MFDEAPNAMGSCLVALGGKLCRDVMLMLVDCASPWGDRPRPTLCNRHVTTYR